MNEKKDHPMVMIGFRVDPIFLEEFQSQIEKQKICRSEAIRNIFNKHIINCLKQQQNETIDCKFRL